MALDKKQTLTIGNLKIKYDPKKTDVTILIGKTQAVIPYADLWTAVFAMADEEKQDHMLPIRAERMESFVRQYSIRAAKDIKEGEMVTFRVPINVPVTVVEGIEAQKVTDKDMTTKDITTGA